jgi:DNA end-binding protein Ku
MAARAIASLTVSFGLVAIPVRLHSATVRAGQVHFHMLHGKDGSRLKQQYVCLKEGTVVNREEIVKGYELAKNQYVMFTPEELKALEEVGSRNIEIAEFVPLESVDPVYFAASYYLTPDRGGARPYALFVAALRDRRRCAVGRWAAHGRDHVIILRPIENALALHQLHFAPEVLPVSELKVEEARVRDPELKLAEQLIDRQTADSFDPTAYRDEVKGRIEAAIQKKVEGEGIAISEPRPAAGANVTDLMDALRKSLDRSSSERAHQRSASASGRRSPKGPRRGDQRQRRGNRTGSHGHQ